MTAPEQTNTEKLTIALVHAFLTLSEGNPGGIPAGLAAQVAAVLDQVGVIAGEPVGELPIPSWLTERVRDESTPVPTEPDHHAEQDNPRVAVAPKQPKTIPKAARGVIL